MVLRAVVTSSNIIHSNLLFELTGEITQTESKFVHVMTKKKKKKNR